MSARPSCPAGLLQCSYFVMVTCAFVRTVANLVARIVPLDLWGAKVSHTPFKTCYQEPIFGYASGTTNSKNENLWCCLGCVNGTGMTRVNARASCKLTKSRAGKV